jgi:hypothetical protein
MTRASSSMPTVLARKSPVRLTETITNVALLTPPGDNQFVRKKSGRDKPVKSSDPFLPGSLVIVTLGSPREKFWGMILALAPAGLSLSGVELASLEDLAVMVKEGEPFTPAVVFFPMHRIERVELDSPNGSLPSLSERFFAKTGLHPSSALTPPLALQAIASIPRAPRERA